MYISHFKLQKYNTIEYKNKRSMNSLLLYADVYWCVFPQPYRPRTSQPGFWLLLLTVSRQTRAQVVMCSEVRHGERQQTQLQFAGLHHLPVDVD